MIKFIPQAMELLHVQVQNLFLLMVYENIIKKNVERNTLSLRLTVFSIRTYN